MKVFKILIINLIILLLIGCGSGGSEAEKETTPSIELTEVQKLTSDLIVERDTEGNCMYEERIDRDTKGLTGVVEIMVEFNAAFEFDNSRQPTQSERESWMFSVCLDFKLVGDPNNK